MSIFIRYVNSDTQQGKEEYLGLPQIVGSKGAKILCTKICKVLVSKDISITQTCFHGLDGTNAMSGEHCRVQRRLNKHEAQHSNYVNCRNHRLVLGFVYLMP